MLKTIRFLKISGGSQKGWYADVPNHTLEENQMVYGSDLLLEAVDRLNGCRNDVSMTLSDNNQAGEFILKLIMKSATALCKGNHFRKLRLADSVLHKF